MRPTDLGKTDYRQRLSFLMSMGVELDSDQHGCSKEVMYRTLFEYQEMKLKKMEWILTQLQDELEDNARFTLSWMAGATEGGDE